jgi:hypothetical protein
VWRRRTVLWMSTRISRLLVDNFGILLIDLVGAKFATGFACETDRFKKKFLIAFTYFFNFYLTKKIKLTFLNSSFTWIELCVDHLTRATCFDLHVNTRFLWRHLWRLLTFHWFYLFWIKNDSSIELENAEFDVEWIFSSLLIIIRTVLHFRLVFQHKINVFHFFSAIMLCKNNCFVVE